MSVKLTNLEKIYWPEEKITKGEMIEYYESVSRYILPYLKDRPLVLHRYPDGIKGFSFVQKDAGKDAPSFVKTALVAHKEKKVNYIVVQNVKTLLYVANLGSIELHPLNASIPRIDFPDYMVFDLDPEAISFKAVVETAQVLHEILEELKMPHFCKTSGATGLHIFIPLDGKWNFVQTRQFAYQLASVARQRLPQVISLERMPKNRQRRVYIDTQQNIRGASMAAAYSLRAKPHGPVSTPLEWKEVNGKLDPLDFTIHTIRQRLARKGDLFKGVLGRGVNLQAYLKKLEKLS
ncbi:MAG TPA: non-homologous end-joining DNA ligase [Chlamydiales bacterium]|nr:non-homologous end-joining DNA ligase [Chlamydiales bacterium]